MLQPVKIFICLIGLVLCGCSFSPSPRSEPAQLKLLPPTEGPADILLKQTITMESQDINQQFIAVLRLQGNRLKLAVLLPTGQQLFLLEYDGKTLIQKKTLTSDIPGKDILAVMQFALWPASSIRQHYTKEGDLFVEITPQQRTLLTSEGVLLQLNYQAETVFIENNQHNYRLIVQPIE